VSRKKLPFGTVGLVQQLSFDEAPQFAVKPWQLGNTEQTRFVVVVHAVDS
jgi:hypothetical protein